MNIRLDLTKRYDLMPVSNRVLISPTPFGCADCGRWFQFARELVQHRYQETCDATVTTPSVHPRYSATTAAESCDGDG